MHEHDEMAEYERAAATLTSRAARAVALTDLAVDLIAQPAADRLALHDADEALRAWRQDIDATPLPELITVDDATRIIHQATHE